MNWTNKYYLYEKIQEFIADNSIQFSCNIIELCKENGWHLIPYNRKDYHTLNSISNDGFSMYRNNQYYILYNPFKGKHRIKFTIAHEIGHIILLHHFFVSSNILMYGGNGIWEEQANIFAQNILMPANVTQELKNKYSTVELANKFNVSRQMVETRLNKLYQDNLWFRKLPSKNF